jgi:hypothetical protein
MDDTLTAMEMNGAKKLVIWYDENVRVTPKSPGEVYFKDNVLVAN